MRSLHAPPPEQSPWNWDSWNEIRLSPSLSLLPVVGLAISYTRHSKTWKGRRPTDELCKGDRLEFIALAIIICQNGLSRVYINTYVSLSLYSLTYWSSLASTKVSDVLPIFILIFHSRSRPTPYLALREIYNIYDSTWEIQFVYSQGPSFPIKRGPEYPSKFLKFDSVSPSLISYSCPYSSIII